MTGSHAGPRGVAPGASGGGGGGASIDPVKLLKQYYPMLILALMVGTGIGVGAHFVLLREYPLWTAKAMFHVQDPIESVSTAIVRVPQSRDEQERYLGTQIQLMTSDIVLNKAVRDRNFVKTEWAKPFVDTKGAIDVDKAVRALQKKVSARMLPQTSLLELTMSTHKDVDSAIIVAAVTDAYMEDHRSRGRSNSTNQRGALTQKINSLETSIRDLITSRGKLLEDARLDDMDIRTSAPSMEQENISRELVQINTDLSSVMSQMDTYLKQLQENRTDMVPDRLRDRLDRDPVMNQYQQKIASLKDSESALLKQGYLVNHPDVLNIRANIDASERQREDYETKKLQEMRAGEIDSIQTAIDSLNSQKKTLDEKNATLSTRRQEIVQARVRFDQIESDLSRLQDDLQRYQAAFTEADLFDFRQNANSEAVGDRVRVIAPAETPTAMSFPKLKTMMLVGGILSVGLVGGLIFLREVLDQRVRGPHEAAMVPRVKVLGIVPEASEDPSKPASIETAFRDSPSGVVTESFRQLRAPLIQKMDYNGHKSLLVMSGMPGSGATTVASNLALGCAGSGERVLIIDANFRRPGMQRVFKLPEGNGLADVLAGTVPLDEAVSATPVEGLSVLCAGTAAGRAVPERLAGEAMNRVLLEASAKFDRIFIDVPPAIVAGDGMSVANRCDAAIIVVRAYAEKRGLLARVRNQLGDTRAEFLGVVVNAVRASAGGYFKRNIKATHQYQNNKR